MMTNVLYLLLGALIGYLFGAVPFGWIFVRLTKGVDLRQIKSGRTGGTNSLRAGGWQLGVLTALSDVFKGAMAIIIMRMLFADALGDLLPWADIITGSMAVIGHNWSIYINWFKKLKK